MLYPKLNDYVFAEHLTSSYVFTVKSTPIPGLVKLSILGMNGTVLPVTDDVVVATCELIPCGLSYQQMLWQVNPKYVRDFIDSLPHKIEVSVKHLVNESINNAAFDETESEIRDMQRRFAVEKHLDEFNCFVDAAELHIEQPWSTATKEEIEDFEYFKRQVFEILDIAGFVVDHLIPDDNGKLYGQPQREEDNEWWYVYKKPDVPVETENTPLDDYVNRHEGI